MQQAQFFLCITSSLRREYAQASGGKTDLCLFSGDSERIALPLLTVFLWYGAFGQNTPVPAFAPLKLDFCCPAHAYDYAMCASGSESTCREAGGTVCALIKPWSVWRPACVVLHKGTSPPPTHIRTGKKIRRITFILQNAWKRLGEKEVEREELKKRNLDGGTWGGGWKKTGSFGWSETLHSPALCS